MTLFYSYLYNINYNNIHIFQNAYLSNLEIINQQYTYLTNALNPNINKNNSFQHPVITSLINFNDKVDTLLKKIKEYI